MRMYAPPPEHQARSMQRLRLRLYLHGLTDRIDATDAELRAALEGVPNVTHYAVLYPLVLNDGLWAALHVLGDVEMITSD